MMRWPTAGRWDCYSGTRVHGVDHLTRRHRAEPVSANTDGI